MTKTCAILPVKAFDRAKSRLRPLLDPSQCDSLARMMADDMLKVLSAVPEFDRIVVLGQGIEQAKLAQVYGCDYKSDDSTLNLSQNVTRLCQTLGEKVERIFFIAADLPLVTPNDVSNVFTSSKTDITICRASRDGGTNALLSCPAAAIRFSFGRDSAKRHALEATTNKRSFEIFDDMAFQRDIDVPDDLFWLCRHGVLSTIPGWLEDLARAANYMRLLPRSIA